MKLTKICDGLDFPEGPIAMADGSVILVEIRRKTLSRVQPDGQIDVIAELGGGPNGAAVGPPVAPQPPMPIRHQPQTNPP